MKKKSVQDILDDVKGEPVELKCESHTLSGEEMQELYHIYALLGQRPMIPDSLSPAGKIYNEIMQRLCKVLQINSRTAMMVAMAKGDYDFHDVLDNLGQVKHFDKSGKLIG